MKAWNSTVFATLLASVAILGGCSTPPATLRSIEGFYTTNSSSPRYAFPEFKLRNGLCQYQYVTDAISNSNPGPAHGHYTLKGCLLTLHWNDGTQSQWILTNRRGRFIMWTPEEYEKYLLTGIIPSDVFYQGKFH